MAKDSKLYQMLANYLKRFTKHQSWLVIILFISIITMNFTLPCLGIRDMGNYENRSLAKLPELQLSDILTFFSMLDKYTNDHFILRNYSSHLLNTVRMNYLGEKIFSPVIIGKDNWLFFEGDVDDFQRQNQFSNRQLEKIKQNLDAITRYLRSRQIYFLFVIAPDKESIYPEYVPDFLPQLEAKSRTDQVVSYVKSNGITNLLDLRAPLIIGKSTREVYFRTDTHWNDYGAFIAYTEILRAVQEHFPDVAAHSIGDFMLEDREYSGDLAGLLSMSGIMREEYVMLMPSFTQMAKITSTEPQQQLSIYQNQMDTSLPRVVFIHDSFGVALEPLLAENFSPFASKFYEIYNEPYRLVNYSLVDQQKPNIVILMVVERYLQTLLW